MSLAGQELTESAILARGDLSSARRWQMSKSTKIKRPALNLLHSCDPDGFVSAAGPCFAASSFSQRPVSGAANIEDRFAKPMPTRLRAQGLNSLMRHQFECFSSELAVVVVRFPQTISDPEAQVPGLVHVTLKRSKMDASKTIPYNFEQSAACCIHLSVAVSLRVICKGHC